MTSSLLGNPHSSSTSSQLSTQRIEDVRLKVLRLFNADPDCFDLVFVANATAGIKLVMEGFRECERGFRYSYHKDSHTSLVGLRENASEHYCFGSDQEVEDWIDTQSSRTPDVENQKLELFGYPAQSNMNGHRLPLSWCAQLQYFSQLGGPKIYTLLDAAALVSTSPLDLSDVSCAPDFAAVSFYKIFGFPDLGGLIVRKESSAPLCQRKYFGGGTVEMVTCMKEQWHIRKEESLHEQLEDGTLPIHSIIALDSAIDVHKKLFGSLQYVSSHTSLLANILFTFLSRLRHDNGLAVCHIYKDVSSCYSDPATQGPIIALNFQDNRGIWVSNAEVEKLAAIRKIQLRSGGLCNPGGTMFSLGLAPWEMKRNFSAGQRCGNDHDVMEGKPTGVIRISLGAMSNLEDIEGFLRFVKEFFVNQHPLPESSLNPSLDESDFYVETLSIFPIKSCGGWQIPPDFAWDIKPEGLAWDREWCLVHQGTRAALSQKRYPRMALIRPSLDLDSGVLRIRYHGPLPPTIPNEITVPLSADPQPFQKSNTQDGRFSFLSSRVCGDSIFAHTYASSHITAFFTAALSTPCTLARFPAAIPGFSTRHSKPDLQSSKRNHHRVSGSSPGQNTVKPKIQPPILLSNESPILTISRSSLNRLNEEIKTSSSILHGSRKAAHASVFRANIIIAQDRAGMESAYDEDHWTGLRIFNGATAPDDDADNNREQAEKAAAEGGVVDLDVLGPCRRCQMVCVDQSTAEKNEEPFVTLAKTRRGEGGKVFFGVHSALAARDGRQGRRARIKVGDRVVPLKEGDGEGQG